MRNKFSRSALVAGLAIGVSGLVAAQADATTITAANNAVTTPTYYVTAPLIGSASGLTPESAVVSGVIDTGGEPGGLLQIPTGGLSWVGGVTIGSGVAWAGDQSGNYVPLFGIPTNDSSSDVSVTVADNLVSTTAPTISSVSNGGADNYSTVTFAFDPVSDYIASGNVPGGQTAYATAVNVPTTSGLASVDATIGAFGQAAQANTGTIPLEPNTQYYYWIEQEAGGTDSATEVNVAGWADSSTNPTLECLPNVAIAQDPTLSGYTSASTVTADGSTQPALAGSCVYYYGDPSSNDSPTSAIGEFTTPKLGTLAIGHNAKAVGKTATVAVTDKSAFKASGSIELDNNAGDTLATGTFSLKPEATASVKLKLTKAGVTASYKHKSGALTLTSNWDQQSAATSIKLLGAKPVKKKKKKKK